MKKCFLVIVILQTLVGVFAQEPSSKKKWTLENCITHAIKNNISVKQAEVDLQTIAIDKRAALGSFLPTLNGDAGSSWKVGLAEDPITGTNRDVDGTLHIFNSSIGSNVTLYNGLQNQKRMQRVKLSKVAAELQLQQIQENTAVVVANSFLEIISNKENVKIRKEQLKNNQLRLKRNQELVDGGQLPMGEVLNIQADVSTSKQQLIVAESELYLSKIQLGQLLLVDDLSNFDVDDSAIEVKPSNIMKQKPEKIVEKALADRIEVKLALSQVNLAEKDIEIAKGAMLPSLSAFYNLNTTYSNSDRFVEGVGWLPANPFVDQLWNNSSHSFGLSLNVPLFNGFSIRNSIDRNKIALEKQMLSLKETKQILEKDIYTAYTAAQRALNTYLAAQETVKARKESFRYEQEKSKVGLSNSFELSNAQVLLTNSQSEMVKAKYDYLFRVKILELYFGVKLF